MNDRSQAIGVSDILHTLREHPRRLIVPTVAVVALAALFAFFRTRQWEASQTLVLRNEAAAADAEEGIGRFRHVEEMKVSQETVFSVARSYPVLKAALEEVGLPSGPEDVDELDDALRITPPSGAELGKTELFYLRVRHKSRDQAQRLAAAVAGQLAAGLRRLREERAQSMIDELTRSVELAEADLRQAAGRLGAVEAQVGADLAELRMIEQGGAGDSDIRRRVNEIENELRQASLERRGAEELLGLLQSAQDDPQSLLATPNRLLESQPALRRLKEGLVDAQLQTAALLGIRSEEHPLVIAARESEAEVRADLRDELGTAIRGVEVELRLTAGRAASLEKQRDQLASRLAKLAGLRADYSTLVADVQHRTRLAETSRKNLAAARATQAGARSASLITALAGPTVSGKPLGPSRITILAGGLLGGLLLGLGLVFLTAQPAPSPQPELEWIDMLDRLDARNKAEAARADARGAGDVSFHSNGATGL